MLDKLLLLVSVDGEDIIHEDVDYIHEVLLLIELSESFTDLVGLVS